MIVLNLILKREPLHIAKERPFDGIQILFAELELGSPLPIINKQTLGLVRLVPVQLGAQDLTILQLGATALGEGDDVVILVTKGPMAPTKELVTIPSIQGFRRRRVAIGPGGVRPSRGSS